MLLAPDLDREATHSTRKLSAKDGQINDALADKSNPNGRSDQSFYRAHQRVGCRTTQGPKNCLARSLDKDFHLSCGDLRQNTPLPSISVIVSLIRFCDRKSVTARLQGSRL